MPGLSGGLEMVPAEVNNTFGETYNYWLTAAEEQTSPKAKRYQTYKVYHLSPFLALDLGYAWAFTLPDVSNAGQPPERTRTC